MKLRRSTMLLTLCLVSSAATASYICGVERVSKIEDGIRVFMRSGYERAVPGLKRNTDGSFDLKEGDKISLSSVPHDSCEGIVVKKEKTLGLEVSEYGCFPNIRCVRTDAFLTVEDDAHDIEANAIASHRKELEELGGSSCSASEVETSAEVFFRRGRILTALNEYHSAMNCFLLAQGRGRDTGVYRDSCSAIGTMYELGWGIEKNMATAMSWFKKAGL